MNKEIFESHTTNRPLSSWNALLNAQKKRTQTRLGFINAQTLDLSFCLNFILFPLFISSTSSAILTFYCINFCTLQFLFFLFPLNSPPALHFFPFFLTLLLSSLYFLFFWSSNSGCSNGVVVLLKGPISSHHLPLLKNRCPITLALQLANLNM